MLCPYCAGTIQAIVIEGARPRPSDQTLSMCNSCDGYAIQRGAKVFPLADRSDPNSPPTTRVID